ncbi:MAG: hypothetical protein IKP53_08185 [Candidatus Methanomethylophilaceae archaeon]|nr:hypothetical protein [Candidatus Methanomethylophilaceae archaeon]
MSRNRAFAWFAVALMLAAPLVAVAADDREESEVDAFPAIAIVFAPNVVGGIVAGFLGGYLAGALITYTLMSSDDSNVRPYLRLMAARDVSNCVDIATKFADNANANYAQIWGMTKEHWIRQAELEAYAEWDADESIDTDSILENATLYRNAAIMSANAVAQFDWAIDNLALSTAGWGTDATYKDQMTVRFSGPINSNFSTKSGVWNADMASVADARGGDGYVYIGGVESSEVLTVDGSGPGYEPGWIYSFSGSTEISGPGGSFTLPEGKHAISELSGFKPGIYMVSKGVIAGDTLAETQGASSLHLMPGLVFRAGTGNAELAYLKDGGVICKGSTLSDMTIQIVPENIPLGTGAPSAVSLKGMLESYGELLNKIAWTATNAANAASAVWGIYSDASAKSYEVTTLMNSFNYEGWLLSAGMAKAATLSAMGQLGEYWKENGDDLSGLYVGLYSAEDMPYAPFVRGSIYDEYGNVRYEDVVYTPFFQSKDATMVSGGEFVVDQSTLIMIWGNADGRSLQRWSSDTIAEGTAYYNSTYAEKGWMLRPTELAICEDGDTGPSMVAQQKIEFKVVKVNFIDPNDVERPTDPDPEPTGTNWVFVIAMALGLICAAYGLLTRNFVYIALGIGLVLFAVVFAGSIWDWICRQKALGGLL